MMCYIDHNAVGEKHGQSCGAKCIKLGGPAGIVSEGKAYLVVGEHKPINDQLAEYCGKNITVKGKIAEREGPIHISNVRVLERGERAAHKGKGSKKKATKEKAPKSKAKEAKEE